MAPKSKGQRCPRCGSRDVLIQDTLERNVTVYVCLDCDHEFSTDGKRREDHREEHRDRRDQRNSRQ